MDNPQTFLYSHPMTSPISRLGSFRPFYPPSWDRTLPSSSATTPTSPSTPVSLNHHHHHHHHHHSPPYGSGSSPPPSSSPSDSPYDTATTKTTTAASVTTSSATFGRWSSSAQDAWIVGVWFLTFACHHRLSPWRTSLHSTHFFLQGRCKQRCKYGTSW